MKRKLLALAIAQLFVPCAFAQGSSVTIYGTFNADFENVEKDGATSSPDGNGLVGTGVSTTGSQVTGGNLDSRNRVSSNSSNIGFRGTEDLGNGLKAIFQLESSLNLDTGGGNLGGRNSHAGLSGPWGTVFYGLWDTPYKFATLRQDAWYSTSIATANAMLGSPGFNVGTSTQSAPGTFGTTAANASFDRRQGDSVQYWTPNFSGWSARISYSANEAKSADDAVPELNPYTYSGAVLYENGPLYINLSYERHEDYFGLSSLTGAAGNPSALNDASQDQGIKFGIGYTFGNTTLNFIYEHLDYENDNGAAGAVTDYDRDAFFVSLLHKIGASTIRASYNHADEAIATPTESRATTAISARIWSRSAPAIAFPSAPTFTHSMYTWTTRIWLHTTSLPRTR